MSSGSTMVKTRRNQILEDSIDRGRQLVVTHNSQSGWRAFRSQFVSGSASTGEVCVKTLVPRDQSVVTLPSVGDALGITFRVGHKKCMFGTVLESLPETQSKDTVSLRWPDHLQQLQRRAFERAAPPPNTVVPVRIWRQSGSVSRSLEARTVRYGQLDDLSAGGMRVKVADPDEFTVGDTYRCAFSTRRGKPSFVVDVLMRHREMGEQGRSSIGFQFIGLEATADGRKMLERLAKTVNMFQRSKAHSRR